MVDGTTQVHEDSWGQPISDTRKIELQRRIDAWMESQPHGKVRGPFDGVPLTGADVSWLAEASGRDKFGNVPELHLEGADLSGAHMENAELGFAHFEGAELIKAHLEGATLFTAHLESAELDSAHLEDANLIGAYLQGATLSDSHLEGAELGDAHLEGCNLHGARLAGADLTGAFTNEASIWTDVILCDESGAAFLADIRWGAANLTHVDWESVRSLGEELVADNKALAYPKPYDKKKRPQTRIEEYLIAARAYRLLSVALRAQGISSHASRFHYRSELMDRKALWHRLRFVPWLFPQWVFSWLLGTIAGYGDYVGRLFAAYAAVVLSFAALMFVAAGRYPAVDSIGDVLILSVTSFHGRGVQPPGLILNDGLAALAAIEAVIGLLIEGLFIAAFTRRVTGG